MVTKFLLQNMYCICTNFSEALELYRNGIGVYDLLYIFTNNSSYQNPLVTVGILNVKAFSITNKSFIHLHPSKLVYTVVHMIIECMLY